MPELKGVSRATVDTIAPAPHQWAGRREQGQTLVMAAVLLVALVAFLALVIDLGIVYAERRLMQNAADAAALAGARRLALGSPYAAIESDVAEYARDRNGAGSYGLQVLTDSVTVSVSKVCRLVFAPVLGMHEMTVEAMAEASYAFPGAWQGPDLMPFAVHSDTLAFACLESCYVEIWDDEKTASDPSSGRIGGGQRGWLNFNGGSVGDAELVIWILAGYNGRVEVGDWINGTPGTKTSALHALDDTRLHKEVIVPIYDQTRPGREGSGSLDYRIVGFARFYVDLVVDRGNPKYVRGVFRHMVTAQEPGGWVDTGVRVIGLR